MRTCGWSNCNRVVHCTDKNTGIGYCMYHKWKRTDIDRRPLVVIAQEKADKKHSESGSKELEKWFFDIKFRECIMNGGGRCWECDEYIPVDYFRYAIAHIIPKSIFKSVATHPSNYLILGASCGCHHKYDNGGMREMKIFPEAQVRFSTFAHLITEKHKLLAVFTETAINGIIRIAEQD